MGDEYPLVMKSWQNGNNKRVYVLEGISQLVAKHGLQVGNVLGLICAEDGSIRFALNPPADLNVRGLSNEQRVAPAGQQMIPSHPQLAQGGQTTMAGTNLPAHLPSRVPVVCGGVRGTFLPHVFAVAVNALELPPPGAASASSDPTAAAAPSTSASQVQAQASAAHKPVERHVTLPEFERLGGKVRSPGDLIHNVSHKTFELPFCHYCF